MAQRQATRLMSYYNHVLKHIPSDGYECDLNLAMSKYFRGESLCYKHMETGRRRFFLMLFRLVSQTNLSQPCPAFRLAISVCPFLLLTKSYSFVRNYFLRLIRGVRCLAKIHVGSDCSYINLICGLARGAVYGNSDFVPILRLLSA